METRRFLVHYEYNGYKDVTDILLFSGEKANIDTFTKEVRRLLCDDGKELSTIIYSWSLIKE